MRHLELSEEQLKSLLVLLDKELRSSGLESLSKVVELYNALVSAQPVETPPDGQEVVPSDK